MNYNVGIDISTTGAIAITYKDKIIDVCMYPKAEYDKKKVTQIDKEIKQLKDVPRIATKIKVLKAEKSKIKRRATRDYKAMFDFLLKYKENIKIVIIEEPILQTAGFTTAQTIASNFTTFGVICAILSCLELEYKTVAPSEWHQCFDFNIPKGKTVAERREIIKQQSIQFSKNMFKNIDDFLILKGCRKENDNIAEAVILSTIGDKI